jgi:hypothetical protein
VPAAAIWRLALLALLVPGDAGAFDLAVSMPRERNGFLYVDTRVREPFGERIGESLARGMPATLYIHTELWRQRSGWFDRLESSFDASVRVRYEVWSERFRLERAGAPPVTVGSIDSVEVFLSRPWSLPVGRIGRIHPRGRYYVVVYATLKPLSVEDMAEVEGWLSGEVETKRRAGVGVVTEIPRAVFDAVRNFAGFGDRRARVVSPEFMLADLFPATP